MATTVDELITIYKAIDQHTPVAKGIAQAQMQMGKGLVDTTRLRQQGEKVLKGEIKTLEQSLKLQMQAAKTSREEYNERSAAARAITAEARARDTLTKAQEREERSTRQLSAARKFANGFGSTRLNFGAASPLISSFTRGGFAGGAGALAATGLAGMGGLGGRLAGGLSSLLSGGIGAGASALLGLGGQAQDAAMQASSRQGRLTAILRDSAEAARVLKTVQGVAAPSTATTSQLADAATTLEAFGVNANRSIPIIGKLATAMGAGEEQMQMFSRAIGELATGNMIDADVMAAMGLQRRDFASKGIQFDGNGKLLSSAEQALTALESIVNDRFGNIFQQMANTPEAKRASLEDAGERALAIIGEGMLKTQGPLVDALTKTLNAAVDSGVLSDVVGRATGEVFRALNLGDQGDAVTGLLARVLAFAEVVPGNLARGLAFVKDFTIAAVSNISEFFKMVENRIDAFVVRLSSVATSGRVIAEGIAAAFEGPLLDAPGTIAKALRQLPGVQSDTDKMVSAMTYNPSYKSLPGLPQINGVSGGRVSEIEARLRASMATPQAGVPTSNANFLRRALGSTEDAKDKQAQDTLGKIAASTEATALNTDPELSESIFGGKRSRGISYADVMGGSAGRGGGITIRTEKAQNTLGQALLEILQENLPEITDAMSRRAGWAQ